jgi:hypothetical protein
LPARAPSRVPRARELDLRPMPQKRAPGARACKSAASQAPQSKTTHNSRSMSQQKAAPRAAKALRQPSDRVASVATRAACTKRRAHRNVVDRLFSRRRTTASTSASVRSSWPRAARPNHGSARTSCSRRARHGRPPWRRHRAPGGRGLVQGVLDDGQRVRRRAHVAARSFIVVARRSDDAVA